MQKLHKKTKLKSSFPINLLFYNNQICIFENASQISQCHVRSACFLVML